MTSRDPRQFLLDILDSARLAQSYVSGLTFATFEEAVQTQDAVIRRLEIIGEAAGNLPQEVIGNIPDVPWAQIRAMRNHLVHRYWGADLQRVWVVIQDDLPPLIAAIEDYLHS